jgi:hypothetical protein
MSRIATIALLLIGPALIAQELQTPRKAAAKIAAQLNSAKKVELLSLHSGEPDGPISDDEAQTKFHGFAVLGTLDISGSPERSTVVKQISKAIARSPLRMVACFYPRHGIRAELENGELVDLLICFECATVYRFSEGREQRLNIKDQPEALLNSLLQKAGIRQGRSARDPSD